MKTPKQPTGKSSPYTPYMQAVENRMIAKGIDRAAAEEWARNNLTFQWCEHLTEQAQIIRKKQPEMSLEELARTFPNYFPPFVIEALSAPEAGAAELPATEAFDKSLTGTAVHKNPADAFYPPRDLANLFGLPYEALKKRLARWREKQEKVKNYDGWKPMEDRRSNEPLYIFQLKAVEIPVIKPMKEKMSRTCPA